MNSITKKCNRCKKERPVEEFVKRRTVFSKPSVTCEKCRETTRGWASRNKESSHRWQVENKEIATEKKKQWRLNNPDIQKKAKETWYAKPENKKRTSEKTKSWKAANWSKVLEYGRKYAETHREQVRLKAKHRRALKKGSGGRITKAEWDNLLEKYNHKCLCCGRTDMKITLDHVIPLKLGGRHVIENAQPLCVSCNSRKGARTIDYR